MGNWSFRDHEEAGTWGSGAAQRGSSYYHPSHRDLGSASTTTAATNVVQLSALYAFTSAHLFCLVLTLARSHPLSYSFPTWPVLPVYIFSASVPTDNSMTSLPAGPIQFPEREAGVGGGGGERERDTHRLI